MDEMRTAPAAPPRPAVVDAVRQALAEDLTPLGDLSSSLLPPGLLASAALVPRVDGVLAGQACATETFAQLDAGVVVDWMAADGDLITAGSPVASVSGALAAILTAERTALNFLGHLSGIATLTRSYVTLTRQASGGRTRVWDTRKTTPGLRGLEKAAVRAGGGANHRGNLSEWVMVKDNHVAVLGVSGAAEVGRSMWPGRTLHMECDKVEQVLEALAADVDAILLDNMTVRAVEECVALAAEAPRRPLIEVSGGISLDTVAAYAATGVDMISVGALTNSAPVLDIGLDVRTDLRPEIDT